MNVELKREYRPQRRNHSILVRYAADEFSVVVVAAARAGLSPTSYVAEAALAAASEAEPPSGAPLHTLAVELMQARLEVRRIGVAVSRAVAALGLAGVPASTLAELAQECQDAVATVDVVAREIGKALQ